MICAVVLAAGGGERFGMPKALAEIDGRSLAEIGATTCASAPLDEVIVVTGARSSDVAERMARVRGAPVRCVENAAWRDGRTGSLQAGWPEGAHALVFPVDHPAVRLVTLDALIGVFGYAAASPDVVVPAIEREGARRRGHPILLASRLRPEVMALGPDQPLRDLVRAREVLEVPVDDEGILLDVDLPADLARAAALVRASPP